MPAVDLSWFDPLAKQASFLDDTSAESCYAGGVGSGKTISGGLRCLLTSLAYPGTVGLVGRQSYRALEDTTKKVILDGDDKPPIIPPELVRDYSKTDQKVTLVNGSEILFRSFQDHAIEKLLSLNLGWAYVDEATETTEKVWLTLLGRLRHPAGPRWAWCTTNPNGHDWVWRRFHPDSGQAVGTLYHAPSAENYHLPADYLLRLQSMPREWVKRFVLANFDTAAGQIWEEWDSAIHVVPDIELPYDWRRIWSLDHGRRNPTCILKAAVDRDGNVWVEDEYYSPGLVSQHASAATFLRGERKMPPLKADPSIFAAGPDGVSVADTYRKHGVDVLPAANDVGAGLLRVSEYLSPHPDEAFPAEHPFAGALGAPRVFVSERCVNLRREIPDYRWRDLSPSQERDRDQPEEPRKKDDHACDSLRYLLADLPRPTPEVVVRPERDDRQVERPREFSAGLGSRTF